MGFDWKKTLATVAPQIATALGGPLAGVAVNVAAKALGVEPDQDAVAAAVASGDPNVLVELRKAEQQFELELRRMGVELERVHADDRASARRLAIARGLQPQAILSTVFVAGFVYVLGLLFQGEAKLSAELMQPAMYVLGILSAGMVQVLNFWFGSSSGSKQKTGEISKALGVRGQ